MGRFLRRRTFGDFMKKTAVTLALLTTLMTLPVASSSAQDYNSPQVVMERIIPSMEVQQADVRETLRQLFKQVKVPYSIAPNVQGTVTMSLKNITFEVALQNLTRQVDATYRIRNGLVEVLLKPSSPDVSFIIHDPAPHFPTTPPVMVPPVITADRQFVYILRGEHLSKVEKKELKIVAGRRLNPGGPMPPVGPDTGAKVTAKFTGEDVRTALRKVFERHKVSWELSPEVQGVVTLNVRDVKLTEAVTALAHQVGATVRIERGVYKIEPDRPVFSFGQSGSQPNLGPNPPSVILEDGDFLYVLQGDLLHKVRKQDLVQIRTVQLPPVHPFLAHGRTGY